MVAEHRGVMLRDLAGLGVEELCTEVAAVLWAKAQETARNVYSLPPSDRGRALWRLRDSDAITAPYAAHLVTAWMDEDRRRGKP